MSAYPMNQTHLETERMRLRAFTPDDLDALVALDSDPAVMRWLTGGAATPREKIAERILPGFIAASARSDGLGVWAAESRAMGEFLGWFSFRAAPTPSPSPARRERGATGSLVSADHETHSASDSPSSADHETHSASDSPSPAARGRGLGGGGVSLGYRLRRAAWGQGLATEGARALIRRGFLELGVQRVLATTYQDNLASQRVLVKAGLRLVRRFRLTPTDLAASATFFTDGEVWDGDDLEYAITRAEWERQVAAEEARDG